MNFDDEQLVARIAQQVIQALGKRGVTTPTQPAAIHPPAGQCTAEGGPKAPASTAEEDASTGPPRLTGIVTEQQLRDAIARHGVALLSHDARLTPLASDFARENPSQVERSTTPASTGQTTAGRWLFWADGHCPAVQAVASTHRDRLLPSGAARTADGLVQVVRSLSQKVARGDVVGGLLFVSSPARAGVLVGACANLRAVVGTSEQGVTQAMHDVSPNVLLIEYPRIGAASIAAMTALMVAQTPRPIPQLIQQLDALRGLS